MTATRTEIVAELEALSSHYLRTVRSAEQQARFLADYVADLQDFELEPIRAGCRKWRQSEANRFPTPGQLLAMVRASLPRHTDREENREWRPLTDAEYEALTLPDKIRHHRILAAAALRKAGPMWLNGRPATAEELPQSWHDWREKSARHSAEAARLQAYLKRGPSAA